MKRLLLLIILCCSYASSQTLGGTVWHNHVNSNTTLAITVAPTAGNTLICPFALSSSGRTITSVKTNGSANFTQDSAIVIGTREMYYYRLTNVPSGVTSVTMIITPLISEMFGFCAEVSGLSATPVDVMDSVGADNGGFSVTWSTGAMITTHANDILFGMAFDTNKSSTLGATSPYLLGAYDSDGTNGYQAALVYRIVTSTGTYTPNGNSNGSSSQVIGLGGSYYASAAARHKVVVSTSK